MQMEPLYREVLVLRFHEDLSLEEIANVTRAPLSTVKSRLYRGLASMKPKLSGSYASEARQIGKCSHRFCTAAIEPDEP
jgi:RNA polymerase sigma-70 factor (ECF subfamily)